MLRISRLTDYAVVVLAHLARNAHVCVHPAPEIAEATSLPPPTVAKVLKTLTREGLLVSTRGAYGGYTLARDPASISVAQVIEAIEGPVALTACSHPEAEPCTEQDHCHLSEHWPRINRAVRLALEQVSILELSSPPERPRGAAPTSLRLES